jgi:hypothetical protein
MGHVPIWGRQMSLWDLPYWASLKLRHNLDVMHIEKNICEALLGIILAIRGKSKDNIIVCLFISLAHLVYQCILEAVGWHRVWPHRTQSMQLQSIVPGNVNFFQKKAT